MMHAAARFKAASPLIYGYIEPVAQEIEQRLFATKPGLKSFKEMWEVHCELDKLLFQPLSASEYKTFVSLMRKLDRFSRVERSNRSTQHQS